MSIVDNVAVGPNILRGFDKLKLDNQIDLIIL
jgi:hypothetical protein